MMRSKIRKITLIYYITGNLVGIGTVEIVRSGNIAIGVTLICIAIAIGVTGAVMQYNLELELDGYEPTDTRSPMIRKLDEWSRRQ